MSEQKEYKIPFEAFETAFGIFTKILWFLIAFGILTGMGNVIWHGLGLPDIALPFTSGQTPLSFALGFIYIMWRFEGGKVKVRADSLVVTYPWGSGNGASD